jgi:hypothetical protein
MEVTPTESSRFNFAEMVCYMIDDLFVILSATRKLQDS